MPRDTLPSPRARTRPLRTISRQRKIAFMALFMVVMAMACEVAVRLRARAKFGSANTDFANAMLVLDQKTGLQVPRPGYEQHGRRVSIKINSLGFRGDEITVEKPPRTIRIATVGASTTFCGEVSRDEATWPSQLQRILRAAHPDFNIQVINAGVPGYGVAESHRNLLHRVLPLNPDIVIYYEANNDLAKDSRELAKQRGLLSTSGESIARSLSTYSLLFDLVYKNARILLAGRDTISGKLDALPDDLPARYIGELDRMHQELSERGIQMVMSTFFVKYRRNQSRATQIRNASISFYYMPWMTIDDLLRGIDLYNDAVVGYAESHGVPVVADRDSIPGDDQHFADWAHFADEGAAAMGARFARFLEERGLVRDAIGRVSRR
jgi:lysophospholipase L1-like esterase